MARKKKEDTPAPGSPAWMSTYGDMVTLLLCFFVLLFSMSTVDAAKFEALASSLSQTFSIFTAGSTAIGDGVLISNGVSQLNELSEYFNTTGQTADSDETTDQMDKENTDADKQWSSVSKAEEFLEESGLKESEELAEKIEETVKENNLADVIDIQFTAQYVELTLKGALLYEPGSATLKQDILPTIDKVGLILQKYSTGTVEIEGHTDNVPMASNRYASNDELSSARALSVFHYLIETTSLNPAYIKHSGRGEYAPIADNSTPEGRAKNRRVEIRIYNSLYSN
ncbi:MAG: flagellar motor protein MotB [Lachnospiraceae bacterium]|nr:flagellar motor protein MotB [Lachnospiraceae bacterium]